MKLLPLFILIFGFELKAKKIKEIEDRFKKDDPCTCLELSLIEYMEHAKLIAHGQIDQINEKKKHLLKLTIERVYKGNKELKELTLDLGKHDCSPKLNVNRKYVFFLNKIIENKAYINKCHLYYEINEKSVNNETHIKLMGYDFEKNKDPNQKRYKTPSYESMMKERKKKSSKFSDKIDKFHKPKYSK